MTCERAAAIVEHALDIPQGLLAAIGHVESGNHPLAVDVGGTPILFARVDFAVDAVQAMLHSGAFGARPRVDVGCFQINLGWHPKTFPSVESGFDPLINAAAAGQFLRSLHAVTGNWRSAVARYHAASEEGTRYASDVFRTYENLPGVLPVRIPGAGPMTRPERMAARRRYAGQLWAAAASGYGLTVFEPVADLPGTRGHGTRHRRVRRTTT